MHWGLMLGLLGIGALACSTEQGNSSTGGGGTTSGGTTSGGTTSESAGARQSNAGNSATAGSAATVAGAPGESESSGGGGAGQPDDASAGEAGAGAASPPVFVSRLNVGRGCLPDALGADADGQIPCAIIEAKPGPCDCGAPGRGPVAARLVDTLRVQLTAGGECATGTGAGSCTDYCLCSIDQEQGAAEAACEADPTRASDDGDVPPGFCYIDDPTSEALAACPNSQKQKLGFVSPSATPTPDPSSLVFIACTSPL